MDFQKKLGELRALPDRTKKIIFWSILVVLSMVFIYLWCWHSAIVLRNFDSGKFIEKLNVPTSTGVKINGLEGAQDGITKQLQEKNK